jgi:hypothetical protein
MKFVEVSGDELRVDYTKLRFNILTAISIKITVFWDVTPCSWQICTSVLERPAISTFMLYDRGSRFL